MNMMMMASWHVGCAINLDCLNMEWVVDTDRLLVRSTSEAVTPIKMDAQSAEAD
jgi:hypothetical protein